MSSYRQALIGQLQQIRQAEKGLIKVARWRMLQAFFKSLTLRDYYTLQSLPDTLARLRLSFGYGRVQALRARFNTHALLKLPTTEDAFLNRYLPYRAKMAATPEQQACYQQALENLLQRIRFFNVSYFPTYCEKLPSTDFSLHVLFCGQILELLHGRPDLIEALLWQQPKGLHVQFCSDFPQTWFDPGYIQINPVTLWMDGAVERSPGVMHVCLHLLSATETDIQTDAIGDMDDSQRQTLQRLKQQLQDLSLKKDFCFWGRLRLLLTGRPDAGVHPYAFFKPMPEFLAMTVENCLKMPQQVAKTEAGRELLGFYRHYFRWAC